MNASFSSPQNKPACSYFHLENHRRRPSGRLSERDEDFMNVYKTSEPISPVSTTSVTRSSENDGKQSLQTPVGRQPLIFKW